MKILTNEEYETLVEKASYRIPKPQEYKRFEEFHAIGVICPRCKRMLPNSYARSDYCPRCGQSIKWVNPLDTETD